ncbi:MAG: Hsp20/alpha crystallin family protein [Pseudomonadota bacterium]
MSSLNRITHNLKETVDHLAEGWQEFWHKARAALTHYTPTDDDPDTTSPEGSRWGVLSADMREFDDNVEVKIEAPGMDAADFDISVDHQLLRIRGKKHYENARKEGRFVITERAYGSFERAIPLPFEVDQGSANACYRKGVLEVVLTKHPSAKPRRITVEGA